MAAEIIDGKAIAQQVRAEVRDEVAAWVAAGHAPPGLATVLVGDDPGVCGLRRRQAEGERRGRHQRLRPPAARGHVAQRGRASCCTSSTRTRGVRDPAAASDAAQVDGRALTEAIDPAKDVDGLTPVSAGLLVKGRPGPAAVHAAGRDRAAAPPRRRARGRRGGRRRPLGSRRQAARRAAAGRERDRHRVRTRARATSPAVCRRADVLVAAVGRPELVRGDWVKLGAVVIDVGINRTDAGLVGRRRVRGRARPRPADHAGARRRRPDDDRHAPAQHAPRRRGPGLMGRLRPADLLAGLGGAVLAGSLFLHWYGLDASTAPTRASARRPADGLAVVHGDGHLAGRDRAARGRGAGGDRVGPRARKAGRRRRARHHRDRGRGAARRLPHAQRPGAGRVRRSAARRVARPRRRRARARGQLSRTEATNPRPARCRRTCRADRLHRLGAAQRGHSRLSDRCSAAIRSCTSLFSPASS